MLKEMKQNKKIKIAILGCGKIASHYIKIFKSKKINNYKLVGFFDININKASFFAKKFSSKAFTDLGKMLDETIPDLAIILTPSGLHYAHTKQVLKKKINAYAFTSLTLVQNFLPKWLEIMIVKLRNKRGKNNINFIKKI